MLKIKFHEITREIVTSFNSHVFSLVKKYKDTFGLDWQPLSRRKNSRSLRGYMIKIIPLCLMPDTE